MDDPGVADDLLVTRAGIVIPPERRAGVRAACADMRAAVALVQAQDLPPEAEPCNVFIQHLPA